MNVIKIMLNSNPLMNREKQILLSLLQQAGYNCADIYFFWCDSFTSENGILGAYIPEKKNNIYLQKGFFPIYSDSIIHDYLLNLLSTVCHELTHRKQYIKNPLTYRIKCIPYIRQLTIEPEARGEELRIEKLIKKGQIK